MGLKYYLNLFKKDSNNEAVKLRYFLNVFVFLVYMVFFVAFFSMRNTNVIASSVFGILALLTVIINRILNKNFSKFIDKLLAEETLNETDETDIAFIEYRKGYTEFNEKSKRLERILFPVNVISSVVLIAILPVSIVLNLLGNTELADKVFFIISIVAFAYLIAVFILSMFLGRQGLWCQNYSGALTLINKYKAANNCGEVKYKILEDKKPKDQSKYLLPDKNLEIKFSRLKKTGNIIGGILGGMVGAFFVLGSTIMDILKINEEKADSIGGIIIISLFAAAIIIVYIFNHLTEKIIRKQYNLLHQNADENKLYIKLHEIRTPYHKRWSILFLVLFIGIIAANIMFAGITSAITKSDKYGWIFSILILVEIIALIVIHFKAYGKVRLKMIAIENEIDRTRVANISHQDHLYL